MLYVFAPNYQQASFWLREFGTHPRDREVLIMAAPFRRTHEDQPEWFHRVLGRRWAEHDEFLVVGNHFDLDLVDVLSAARYLGVPEDIVEREVAAQ